MCLFFFFLSCIHCCDKIVPHLTELQSSVYDKEGWLLFKQGLVGSVFLFFIFLLKWNLNTELKKKNNLLRFFMSDTDGRDCFYQFINEKCTD